MEKTISMSQLSKNAEQIAHDIESAGTVYRIKRPGHAAMLLVSDAYVTRLRATFELVKQHPDWRAEMAENRRAVRDGEGVSLRTISSELGARSAREKANSRPPRRKPAASGTSRRSPKSR